MIKDLSLCTQADALLFRENDAADLAAKLSALPVQAPAEREAIGLYLRTQGQRLHSLPTLADRILNLLRSFTL